MKTAKKTPATLQTKLAAALAPNQELREHPTLRGGWAICEKGTLMAYEWGTLQELANGRV